MMKLTVLAVVVAVAAASGMYDNYGYGYDRSYNERTVNPVLRKYLRPVAGNRNYMNYGGYGYGAPGSGYRSYSSEGYNYSPMNYGRLSYNYGSPNYGYGRLSYGYGRAI